MLQFSDVFTSSCLSLPCCVRSPTNSFLFSNRLSRLTTSLFESPSANQNTLPIGNWYTSILNSDVPNYYFIVFLAISLIILRFSLFFFFTSFLSFSFLLSFFFFTSFLSFFFTSFLSFFLSFFLTFSSSFYLFFFFLFFFLSKIFHFLFFFFVFLPSFSFFFFLYIF